MEDVGVRAIRQSPPRRFVILDSAFRISYTDGLPVAIGHAKMQQRLPKHLERVVRKLTALWAKDDRACPEGICIVEPGVCMRVFVLRSPAERNIGITFEPYRRRVEDTQE